ncbi:MAG: nuclear transport factor 2 family protein [Terracidiphilus sp.]
MNQSPESVARAFVNAINRQDVDALTELMAPGHRFIDSLANEVKGREKMGAGWRSYFNMVPDYTIAVAETYCDGPVVVMLGEARGTFAPDGQMRAENRWTTPAAFRAFVEEGKVAEWRIYADNEAIRRCMAGGK